MKYKRLLSGILMPTILAAGVLSACGREQDIGAKEMQTAENDAGNGQETDAADGESAKVSDTVSGTDTDASAQPDQWKRRFGENCISDQTFELELSEYSKKVCFVPFAPSGSGQDFHMQIIQDKEVLADLPGYVPEALSGKDFQSLDAVSFYDVNYDGATDILLIETYGDTVFAAVYYGYTDDAEEYEKYFMVQEQLSEQITAQTEALTVPAIRDLLSGGKKNGEFSDYQEAYAAVGKLNELESAGSRTYGLIYVDDDKIPELAAGAEGYYTSLYTFHDGKVCTLMDRWAYGAMGNAGYEYAPEKNSLRNYNSDFAGAVLYTTYMEISDSDTLNISAEIKTVNFDDVNQNGVPDEEEMDSFGMYGVSYIDGEEVSGEECASYDAGEYEMILGTMSLEELKAELQKTS